ncbi:MULTISPECIES: hypothetical protein [Methanosarcina]|jgi:hypothetical protein|uniref:Uncharacterized protein n=8 Tax=Methanosarcina mazei TaxID=2209 RepID=A0A0F8JKE3_METMZ|nr:MULTISPECIES: hypothetical protein [Methanosarcina]AAM29960.1 conserved protein [Methanosarcina mazei Go1]AGF95723.1 hypothetical protein MmTuc01_0274 [Methanosarcina mazei Tuc01]AKB40010.1 hypothetical protein MSMAW_1019 [Methanosarcina mazei WWM610]AKB60970.1 hypothetical protein MSMAP_0985 [Methanosarcina mazei SarPi]AKB64233.1 hypothetical protein MSMAS_1037 [Methanosarcina mazei S-6]
MSFTLNIETGFSPQEVREAIRSALEHEKHVAKYKIDRYSAICKGFEKKFGYGSGELRERFEAGGIGKDSDFFDWYTAKRELDHWNRKLEILSGISFS